MRPESKAKLVAILAYHVVPANFMAAEVKSGEVPTVNGKVIATGLVGCNGVNHVVDAVILPSTAGRCSSWQFQAIHPGR